MTTTLPQPTKRTRPAPGPGAQPGAKPGVKPGVKPGTKPGVKPGAKPDPRTTRERPAARAPRTPFVLLIVGLLGGALVSLLLLNTVLAEDSFRLDDLKQQNTQLLQREQGLKVDVKKAESPAELARRAHDLGMKPGPMSPRFADAKHPRSGPAAGLANGHKNKNKHHRNGQAAHPRRSAGPRAHHPARTPQNGHKRHRASPAPSASGDGAFAGGG